MPQIAETWVLRPLDEEHGTFILILPNDSFGPRKVTIELQDGTIIEAEPDVDATERLQVNLIRRTEELLA